MPRCKSCEALIVFAKTEKGHRIPLDAEVLDGTLCAVCPSPDPADYTPETMHLCPSLIAVGEIGDSRNPVVVRYARKGEGRFRTHFASCPNAREHRRTDRR